MSVSAVPLKAAGAMCHASRRGTVMNTAVPRPVPRGAHVHCGLDEPAGNYAGVLHITSGELGT